MDAPPDPGPDPETLAALRREYGDAGLDLPDLAADPVSMFRRWLDDTVAAGVHEPNAMVVTSVSAQGRPSARMVLLKAVDERGFVFYTNYDSRKGHELDAEPACALLFPWHDLQRQVRVEGTAERVSRRGERGLLRQPAPRFAARRLGLAAVGRRWVRATSSTRCTPTWRSGSPASDVPLPPQWGGFRVVPEVVEFWQGRKGRMHDRLVYRRAAEGWETGRLAP